jgi:hypothetical protein
LQTFPAEQSAFELQVAVQLVPPQMYGWQDWVMPGLQLPMPSQRPASVTVEPVQVWVVQALPGA